MNRFTSSLALIATVSILGCKTTGGSDTVVPTPPIYVGSVTRLKPEPAPQHSFGPSVVDAIQPPAPPSEQQPHLAPILLRNHMSDEAVPKERDARRVAGKDTVPHAAASTAAQEVVHTLGVLEAIPHSVVSILSSVRMQRSERPPRRDSAATDQASAAHSDRVVSAGSSIWSFATPVLSGLCVYILAPLLVDLLKQRIPFTRRAADAGKPAQAT